MPEKARLEDFVVTIHNLVMIGNLFQEAIIGKTIAILGAGPGLGMGVARHFGKLGYGIALLSRNLDKLEKLASELNGEGYDAKTFSVDLSVPQAVAVAIDAVRGHFGRIDAIYYAPNANSGFTAAKDISAEKAGEDVSLLYLGLVAAVQAVLPEFRAQGGGSILAALGGSAAGPRPFMSGPGPGMSAARNYLISLQGELAAENIHVGIATVSAIIRQSAFHQFLQSEGTTLNGPDGLPVAEVDPEYLVQLLVEVTQNPDLVEFSYP